VLPVTVITGACARLHRAYICWAQNLRLGFREPFLTPNPSHTIVARTEGYTYAVKVWELCLVHGPISVAPCQTLIVYVRLRTHRF
jgi:hypothetical protein